MDAEVIKSLVNSMSRFIHLVSCRSMKNVAVQKDYRNMVSLLKLLKPVLDEVINFQIPSDEMLVKEFEELDMGVNEAREVMEKWCPKRSKICCVLQSEPLMVKIQNSSLEICHILSQLLQSSSSISHSACSFIQHCMQEIQCMEMERTSELIEAALRDQRENLRPKSEHLMKITELLGLTSNQELLTEGIALEHERENSVLKKNIGEADCIEQIIDIVASIRDCMFKLEQFETLNGILIPSYFRCPLSLELMLDPVIVASGQTYERVFIKKWLDQGLKRCPKTRQTLIHSNFISNYTVKGLIANWCEENNIRLNKSVEFPDVSSLSLSHGNHEDIIRVDSFCSSLHSDSTSHSSFDVGNTSLRQRAIAVSSTSIEDDFNSVDHRQILTDKVTLNSKPPLEQSYSHSRSESVSSAVSSVDYVPAASAAVLTEASRVSSKCDDTSEVSGEVISACPISLPSNEDSGLSPWLSGSQIHSVNPIVLAENVNRNNNKYPPSTFSDSAYDDLTTFSHVQKLVEDLKTQSNELHTAAAAELRLLAKHNMDNRTIIAKCGAISLLVSLLYSKVKVIQENAVTALLNLSINDTNKTMIAEAGAIDPLIHVLKSGNMEARENSAATLFSLSVLEEYKIKIGRSGAVKALVDLLGFGSLRGKKDAATALFNLSIFHENKARIVQAGAVKYLVELMDPGRGMADKAIALLANLATIPEGRMAITREGGIPSLVEAVESGSQRGKENAASALFQLCFNSHKFCRLVLQEGAVPPLVALSQSGTPRAKEKAQQLLSHFRSQREGSVGKVKS